MKNKFLNKLIEKRSVYKNSVCIGEEESKKKWREEERKKERKKERWRREKSENSVDKWSRIDTYV